MPLVENDHVVEAFAADGSDQALPCGQNTRPNRTPVGSRKSAERQLG
jgi:hypothetical protein